jgi:hypothetical protein
VADLPPELREGLADRYARPDAFDNDAAAWGVALAGLYDLSGDRRPAAAYGDSAQVAVE